MSNLINIMDCPIEYYKNGNVKAYQSYVTHVKLKKTIKVKHKDYSEFNMRFNNAVEELKLEWEVKVMNESVTNFITESKRFHELSVRVNPVELKDLLLQYNNNKFQKPLKGSHLSLVQVSNKPDKNDGRYLYNLKPYHKILSIIIFPWIYEARKKYYKDLLEYNNALKKNEIIKNENIKIDKQYSKEYDKYLSSINSEKGKIDNHNKRVIKFFEEYKEGKKEAVEKFLSLTITRNLKEVTIFKDINFDIQFDDEDRTLIFNLNLPNESQFPQYKSFKFIKKSKNIEKVQFKAKDLNEIIISTYYSFCIGIVNYIIKSDIVNLLQYIVLNGIYNGLDTRIGKEFTSCIMTCKISTNEFKDIDLMKIDPKETFKYFSGRGVPDPQNINPVTPIRFIDKSKFKLIESSKVLAHLSSEMNLAAMDWRDFETLIRELFELEFKDENIEIRNTQYSNDGGIDIVAFNNNPYTGGIILLQAKRYTNTVQPEPVRALRGSMDFSNAIRGILVTTSDFGSSSYEFANLNNITLINGNQLVEMFKKHGYDFHIDLEQAKLLNQN